MRGNLFSFHERYQEAIKDFTEAIRLSLPEYRHVLLGSRAFALSSNGQYPQAVKDYTEAIRTRPAGVSSVADYAGRGSAYRSMGRLDLAIPDYTTAINQDPKNAGLHYFRGEAYRGVGDYVKAGADFDKARELDPNTYNIILGPPRKERPADEKKKGDDSKH